MNNTELNNLLCQYIIDPENPDYNFNLGLFYENIGQTASAVSYYLRTAERTEVDLVKYECLIRASICFDKQGSRNYTVKGLLQNSVAVLPTRPEAYYLLSRYYEKKNEWNDCYLIASIGDKVCTYDQEKLTTDVGYPGDYAILFEKSVSSWWCGLCDESRDLTQNLLENYNMDEIHVSAARNNLNSLLESNKNLHEVYTPKKYQNFDWGLCKENYWFYETVKKEIFVDKVYQKFFDIDEGDVIFDVGASVGPFTYSILDKNPKKVFCFEPHNQLFETLKRNLSKTDIDIEFVNKAILGVDGSTDTMGLFNEKLTGTCMEENLRTVDAVTFSTFVEENKVTQIDFLKTDCEGGEYDIFNDGNLPWIQSNVKKIAGEWHLSDDNLKKKFRHFRDTYLKQFPSHEIYSMDGVNIKHDLWTEWFIEYYGTITVYIDNRKVHSDKKWKNSIAPTMEFTTSIPEKGCVVDCVFCPQRTLQMVYTGKRTMSLVDFKIAVDKLPQEVRVTFAGFTEPWLNKKCTDMVLYAHEKGHPVSVFTTGIGMSINDIERIKHIPFAGNPNGGFVLHLPDQERKAKHPITKRYIEVIEHFGKIHSEIQNFTLMTMGTVHNDVKHVFSQAPTYTMWSRAGNLLGESIMKPELLNRKNEYNSIFHGDQPMTCGCDERLYHNVMLPNGDVSLCCMDYGLEHILGNLYEQEYEDIIPENKTCFNLCKFCENAVKP